MRCMVLYCRTEADAAGEFCAAHVAAPPHVSQLLCPRCRKMRRVPKEQTCAYCMGKSLTTKQRTEFRPRHAAYIAVDASGERYEFRAFNELSVEQLKLVASTKFKVTMLDIVAEVRAGGFGEDD